jgi:hypothetical protein
LNPIVETFPALSSEETCIVGFGPWRPPKK